MKHKIDLTTLPDLKGEDIRIIRTVEQLKDFLRTLRQDWYSHDKLANMDLESNFSRWVGRRKPFTEMFYIVENDKDDLARNDDWGGYTLYRAIAIRVSDDEVHVLKSQICEFSH